MMTMRVFWISALAVAYVYVGIRRCSSSGPDASASGARSNRTDDADPVRDRAACRVSIVIAARNEGGAPAGPHRQPAGLDYPADRRADHRRLRRIDRRHARRAVARTARFVDRVAAPPQRQGAALNAGIGARAPATS